MKRAWNELNPTLRGFLIIGLIVVIVVVLQLQATVVSLFLIAQIAFFLAIAYFIFLAWRDRRQEISMWSSRSRIVFYGSAVLLVVNIAVRFWEPVGGGWNLIAFLAVFVLAGFAMWRVWRDEHSYGYEASARTAAPSSSASASRISQCRPTKIGVSLSV